MLPAKVLCSFDFKGVLEELSDAVQMAFSAWPGILKTWVALLTLISVAVEL